MIEAHKKQAAKARSCASEFLQPTLVCTHQTTYAAINGGLLEERMILQLLR